MIFKIDSFLHELQTRYKLNIYEINKLGLKDLTSLIKYVKLKLIYIILYLYLYMT